MNLYKKYLSLHLKSELEYKLSFLMNFFTQAIILFSSYFIILNLFNKFGNLKGYTVYEIMIIYGVIQFGFAINEVFNRGFDHFDRLIVNGDFDRLLTRPRNLYLQILGWDIDYARLARVIESLIILIIGILKVDIVWNLYKIVTIIFMLISAVCIFFSIYLVGAAVCFITIEGLEAKNIFTDGGRELAQYPIEIYSKPLKLFFTFIIPFAFVNYYPMLYILEIKSNYIYMFTPLLAILYIIPGILIFKRSLRYYTSSGS